MTASADKAVGQSSKLKVEVVERLLDFLRPSAFDDYSQDLEHKGSCTGIVHHFGIAMLHAQLHSERDL